MFLAKLLIEATSFLDLQLKISLVFRVKLAKNLIIHPNWCNWCDSNGAYDYAIIQLVQDIVFSPTANAACLPSFTDPSTTDGKTKAFKIVSR